MLLIASKPPHLGNARISSSISRAEKPAVARYRVGKVPPCRCLPHVKMLLCNVAGGRYFSAFPTVDAAFGSCGSFLAKGTLQSCLDSIGVFSVVS